jgi:ribosomal protein L12E/L44/L45/RPP1/RPP2
MKHQDLRQDLTQEQLLALFDVAQAEPETRLLQMVVEHLDDKNTLEAAASVTKALHETGWREPLLSLPSEILPPLA